MLYTTELAQHMLDIGIIELENCKYSLTASNHFAPSDLAKHFETIKEVFANTAYQNRTFDQWEIEACCKTCILSLIGLWNSTEQHSWSSCISKYQTDAGQNVRLKRDMGDGSFKFFSSVELVSLHTMFPWGLIALHNERMMMSVAQQEINKYPELKIVAGHVDQWYVLRPYDSGHLVDNVIDACRFKSGEPMLQVKSVRIETVPTWSQKLEHRNQVLKFAKKRLVPLLEQDLGANLAMCIVQKFKEYGGLLLSGPAGVGKTW